MATDGAPPIPLPNDPSLEQLRKQARELQAEMRRDDPSLKLSAAQRAVARRYGFASWPKLVHHLEVVARYTWRPEDAPADPMPGGDFLRLACLAYTDDDGPDRWARAHAFLGDQPNIARVDVHNAAACADASALRDLLGADPMSARREGGPFRWEPLMYLAYARHDPGITEARVVESARLLLDHGADANIGYLWHGMPSPFTALTGAFGEGELGPVRQPRHPRSLALARVLLEAGADPNDSQTLYNRMFGDDDDHLMLLLEFGLGTGDGGPWRARLGDVIAAPAELLRGQLRWAVMHDQPARVRLLLEHGVDPVAAIRDGRTPLELALLSGNAAVAAILEQHGAAEPRLDGVDAFVAAVLADDRSAVEATDREVIERAKTARPGLIVWSAARRNAAAVALLVELGFDVNARGRADVPVEQEWETALHAAVANGDRGLVDLLLAAGADPDIRDARFDATPLGWARYGDHAELVALLEPLVPGPGRVTSPSVHPWFPRRSGSAHAIATSPS